MTYNQLNQGYEYPTQQSTLVDKKQSLNAQILELQPQVNILSQESLQIQIQNQNSQYNQNQNNQIEQQQVQNQTIPQNYCPCVDLKIEANQFLKQPTLHQEQILLCSHCQSTITSEIQHKIGKRGYMWSFIFLVCCWPMTCAPCICDGFKDTEHYCSKCQNTLGIVKR